MILGLLAGAFGGWVDTLIMRIVDVMLSIPSLLLAISIGVLFTNPNLTSVIIAVGIPQIPVFARLLRGQMLAQRESDHVLAARALGVKQTSIVFRHMLPNSVSPVIVQATLVVATSILDAAALSFLGLGSQDVSQPEWGRCSARRRPASTRTRSWRSGPPARSSWSCWASPCSANRCAKPSTRRTGGEPAMTALLQVEDLTVQFNRKGVAPFTAVDKVSFDVAPGQTVGLVGESGCGKSVTSLAIMRLLPQRGTTITGTVDFEGTDLLTLPLDDMRDRRGRDLAMIFQDPLSSLNPVVPIGIQVTEVLERHRGMKRSRRHVGGPRPAGFGGHPRPVHAGSRSTRTSCPAACGSAR